MCACFMKCCGLALVSLVVLGCTGTEGPQLIHVSGMVNAKGSPLPVGSVSFENPSSGYAGMSEVQDGKFTLTVPAGEYKVAVGPLMKEVESADGQSAPDQQELGAENIPPAYRSIETSTLTADVSADSAEFTFELQ